MLRNFVLPFLSLSVLWGCNSVKEVDLIGKWTPFDLVQSMDSSSIDLSKSQLTFNESNQYVYQKTAFEIISGHYKVDFPILYLYPNSHSDTSRLQILKLEDDTLTLRMNRQGNEELLKLKRQEP